VDKRGGKHLRFELVKGLSADASRHLVLVTATPHSGKEDAFRSLLSILKEDFADLPDDLTGQQTEAVRRELAQYFVQRRRVDIESFADEDTVFPKRLFEEATYALSPEYASLFKKVLAYARETVFARLEKEMGITDLKQHIKFEIIHTPKTWKEKFNLVKGSAFGLSHNFWQVGYLRPHNRHAKYKNLYFAGASTHPGTGLPIVLLSARLTTERILKEMGTISVQNMKNALMAATE
jgi:hypothetical protein